MTEPLGVWRASIRVLAEARLAVEDMMQSLSMSITSFEVDQGTAWMVHGFTMMRPDHQALQIDLCRVLHACRCEQVGTFVIDFLPKRDWLAENIADFTPLRIGRYFIFCSHSQSRVPSGTVILNIDPSTAFGSGEHPTTSGCLNILSELARARNFRRPLDMGCGSGILALAMAKSWRRPVVASDSDPEAIRVTRVNALKNRISPLVRTVCGIGFRSQIVNQARPFDLIVANIFARPLISMAGDLERNLQAASAGGGTVILSGFLESDARWVIAAYRTRGLMLKRMFIYDGWATLLLAR